MTTREAKQRGAEHFAQGKQVTPFDCREFDAEVFALIRGKEQLDRLREYNRLRGAFNAGWEAAYAEAVGLPAHA